MQNISKFVVLFPLSAATVLFAMSKDMNLFHQTENVSMYFKPSSVAGRGIKSVVVVVDFENTQKNQDGKEIRSIRMVQNYDCAGSRIRLENAINYSENLLRGNEVSRGSQVTSWQRIPKGTPYDKLLKKVCDK